jgi:hypothetical protein
MLKNQYLDLEVSLERLLRILWITNNLNSLGTEILIRLAQLKDEVLKNLIALPSKLKWFFDLSVQVKMS